MAKWRVEQLKYDANTQIWAKKGSWEVAGETPEEALKYVFVNYLEMAQEFDEHISEATPDLYGLTLRVDDRIWSVKPAGAGVPG